MPEPTEADLALVEQIKTLLLPQPLAEPRIPYYIALGLLPQGYKYGDPIGDGHE